MKTLTGILHWTLLGIGLAALYCLCPILALSELASGGLFSDDDDE